MTYPDRKYQLAILVVLYGCGVSSSRTINNLLASEGWFKGKIKIVIWNNGPVADNNSGGTIAGLRSMGGVSVDYVESLNNLPLSKIYNEFLQIYDADSYQIFDHDSEFCGDIFDAVMAPVSEDFWVPRIIFGEECHGPIHNGKVINKDSKISLSVRDSFFAIGSGMVLRRAAIEKLKRHYATIFDENFALYGVDSSIWLRVLSICGIEGFSIICSSEITHSLSRLEREDSSTVVFRRKERGLDFGITLRNYPSGRRLLNFIRLCCARPFRRSPIYSGIPSIRWAVRGFLLGRHPRCSLGLTMAKRND